MTLLYRFIMTINYLKIVHDRYLIKKMQIACLHKIVVITQRCIPDSN